MKFHTFFLAATLGMLAVAAPWSAAADTWPARPITVVVGQPPGGALDSMARMYAEHLGRELKQAVVVDNRPGAGGNVGQSFVAKAPRDGYTLSITGTGQFDANPSLYKNAGFDPIKDFAPVTMIGTGAYLMVAHAGFPPNSVRELIDYAKAKPGQIFYASAGNGTINHLLPEMFKRQTGTDMTHVPYKGAAAAVADVAAGRAQWSLQSLSSAQPFITSGHLKVLAVLAEKREKVLPQVLTIAETVPGFSTTVWYGVFAPQGTPPAIMSQLTKASARVIADAEFQQKLARIGVEAKSIERDEFSRIVRTGVDTWAKIIRETGITVD